jgi:hypothetical protein
MLGVAASMALTLVSWNLYADYYDQHHTAQYASGRRNASLLRRPVGTVRVHIRSAGRPRGCCTVSGPSTGYFGDGDLGSIACPEHSCGSATPRPSSRVCGGRG